LKYGDQCKIIYLFEEQYEYQDQRETDDGGGPSTREGLVGIGSEAGTFGR